MGLVTEDLPRKDRTTGTGVLQPSVVTDQLLSFCWCSNLTEIHSERVGINVFFNPPCLVGIWTFFFSYAKNIQQGVPQT
jgi:hypothetical protein